MIKVYLDDERPTPEGWTRVYWPNEAIKLLELGNVEIISLDHDLGDVQSGTGYDVIVWLEEQVLMHGFIPPKITVHSANPPARLKMEAGIRNIEKFVSRRHADS